MTRRGAGWPGSIFDFFAFKEVLESGFMLTTIVLSTGGLQTYSSEAPSSRTFICKPLFAGASRNQFQGQRFRATTVRVVSNELANVRVDVYHCHGLTAVSASWESQRSDKMPRGLVKMHTVAIDAALPAP